MSEEPLEWLGRDELIRRLMAAQGFALKPPAAPESPAQASPPRPKVEAAARRLLDYDHTPRCRACGGVREQRRCWANGCPEAELASALDDG